MKPVVFHRVAIVLSLVALIAVWTTFLTVRARGQQSPDVNAKRTAVNPSTTPEPSVPSPTATKGAAPEARQQQPAKQAEDKSIAGEQPGGITKERDLGKEAQKEGTTLPLTYSREAVFISALMVLVLGFLFVLQLYYAHRLDQTSYLGKVFRESVLNFERSRLEAQHRDKWSKGGYLQEAVSSEAPPALDAPLDALDEDFGFGELRYLRDQFFAGAMGLGGGQNPFEGSPTRRGSTGSGIGLLKSDQALQDDPGKNEYRKQAEDYKRRLREWQEKIKKDAYSTYHTDLNQDDSKAEEHTKLVIDETEGALLRGQGPQFVLEFTALIVIIFLAVVLGVLGVLKEQQIGTLLAAIAGYVLGKATTPRATAAGETTKGKV